MGNRCIPDIQEFVSLNLKTNALEQVLAADYFRVSIIQLYEDLNLIGLLSLASLVITIILVFLLRYIAKLMLLLVLLLSSLGSIGK